MHGLRLCHDRSYVFHRSIPLRHRLALLRLRVFGVQLNANVGRIHNRPPLAWRCALCGNQADEDELHVLYACPAYAGIRPGIFANPDNAQTLAHKRTAYKDNVQATARFVFLALCWRTKCLQQQQHQEAQEV